MPSGQRNEGSLDPVFVLGVLQSHAFQPIHDQQLGQGYLVNVGQEGRTVSVGVFPEVNSVQLVSGTSILRLENVQKIRRSGEKLHFEAVQADEKVSIDISPQGVFSLRRQPLVAIGEADTEEAERQPTVTREAAGHTPHTPLASDVPAPEAPVSPGMVETTARSDVAGAPARRQRKKPVAQTPQESTATAEHTTTQERSDDRVTIRGRVGREAQFRTTKRRGVFIGSFPLGEHPDLETTIWHNVIVFGDRAQKLQEKGLTRGQEIEVVGYVHEREITSDGKGSEGKPGRKTVREIYATAIRTTLRTPPKDAAE